MAVYMYVCIWLGFRVRVSIRVSIRVRVRIRVSVRFWVRFRLCHDMFRRSEGVAARRRGMRPDSAGKEENNFGFFSRKKLHFSIHRVK